MAENMVADYSMDMNEAIHLSSLLLDPDLADDIAGNGFTVPMIMELADSQGLSPSEALLQMAAEADAQ